MVHAWPLAGCLTGFLGPWEHGLWHPLSQGQPPYCAVLPAPQGVGHCVGQTAGDLVTQLAPAGIMTLQLSGLFYISLFYISLLLAVTSPLTSCGEKSLAPPYLHFLILNVMLKVT